jgi:hypothetical protein
MDLKPWPKANDSGRHRKNVRHLGHCFPVFQAIRDEPQSQDFSPLNGIIAGWAIHDHAGQFHHFRDPTAVVFFFGCDGKVLDQPS